MDPQHFSDEQVERELAALSNEELERIVQSAPAPRRAPHGDGHGRVHGRVVEVRGADVFVDLGGKSEAYLPIDEFPEHEPPQPGQVYAFIMQGRDAASGMMRLSLREARLDARLESLKVGDVVDARVTGVNIGGLELIAGQARAFMPKSQVDLNRVEDFSHFIGRRMDCEITEIDRRNKNLVVSHRRVLERQREAQRRELQSTLEVGQRRKGTVRRLTDFGAFVDIGGVDGLLHVSDMSWSRVAKPSDLLKEGQQIEVQVLKIDEQKGRISLGAKQLEPDPWELVEANFRPGATVDGRVTRLMNFGAFVELAPGVEGLLPIGEMSWTQRLRHPKDMVSENDMVRVSILSVDPEHRKISLSLKALAADPWQGVEQRYPEGQTVTGRVKRLADFGAFVELEEGVEGLVHVSELSDKRIRTPADVCKEGDTVQVRIKSVDPQQRRISLSMRQQVDSGEASPAEVAAYAAGAPAGAGKPQRKKRPLRGGLD